MLGAIIFDVCSIVPWDQHEGRKPAPGIVYCPFQLINARHERASTVLTSNKGYE